MLLQIQRGESSCLPNWITTQPLRSSSDTELTALTYNGANVDNVDRIFLFLSALHIQFKQLVSLPLLSPRLSRHLPESLKVQNVTRYLDNGHGSHLKQTCSS